MKRSSGNKKFSRLLPMLVLALVFTFAATVLAAPGDVRLRKAKAGSRKVTLTWTRASDADGYYIYTVTGGTARKIARVNGASRVKCVVRGLENGRTYRFAVAACKGAQTGRISNSKKATPQFTDPGKIREARLYMNQYKSCILRWGSNTNVTHYQILWQNDAGAYVPLTEVSRGTHRLRITKLKSGTTYRFRIRAVVRRGDEVAYGPMSSVMVARPLSKKTLRSLEPDIHPFYYRARTRKTMQAEGVVIPAGKRVTVTKKESAKSVITYNKQSYKVPTSALEFLSYIYDPKKAPAAFRAQTFVNTRGYQSETEYLIWINTYSQHLYLFKGTQYDWRLTNDLRCATGMMSYPTPIAVSQIHYKKKVWDFTDEISKRLGGDRQVGYWAMRIQGGAIHSWLYNYTRELRETGQEPSGQPRYLWNREHYGHPESHGCVRIPIKFCKWMYDNVPVDTTVVVY